MTNTHEYDVVILGTGIGGTILGAILARHGVKTLMIEEGVHPRFAVGESVVPATGTLMRILADRYDLPELRHCGSFRGVRDHISPACGIKRSFTFAYHRPGEEQRSGEMTQVLTGRPPFGPDSHLFRQDVDAYMLATAVRYGAAVYQQARVTDVRRTTENGSAAWQLETDRGAHVSARYLVDGSGFRSILADKFKLRVQPLDMQTHSRSIFTHMVGVRPYEACRTFSRFKGVASLPSQGTLHHLFDGGWIWVIPFDNHASSTNKLCSVGLQLDTRRYPRTGRSAQDEFDDFVRRFPSLGEQFETAVAIRDWISTNRLQYASHQVVGDGYCLLPHAAGFVDALYSSGLAMTLYILNSLTGRLIEAVRTNDFSQARFTYIDECSRRDLLHVDRLVACSYTAFRDFELWNAWFRVFVLGAILWNFALNKVHLDYLASRDRAVFDILESEPYRGVLVRDFGEYASIFDAAARHMEAVEREEEPADAAASAIFELVERAAVVPPQLRLGIREHRYISTFQPMMMIRLLHWRRHGAAPYVHDNFFNFRVSPLVASMIKDRMASSRYMARRAVMALLGDLAG